MEIKKLIIYIYFFIIQNFFMCSEYNYNLKNNDKMKEVLAPS